MYDAAYSRRTFVGMSGGALALFGTLPAVCQPDERHDGSVYDTFPSQHADLVRETVGASHGNINRVRELLKAHPNLAKAAWDWGFGDWETALGAAAHTGRREIAALLIEHGARPDIFVAAMLGQVDVVRAFCTAVPGVQRIPGPHGITLMRHALAGGEHAKDVVAYLEELGDADMRPRDLPISAEDRTACLGTYRFGEGERDTLIITERGDQLFLQRGADGTARALLHQGEYVFHPAGATPVRIVMVRRRGSMAGIEVFDPERVITALREG